ncbi:MAG: CRISPR-associated endonuclease Cas2 [candidate division KSB1 bacterium]|nr:CRISPR-associated endonuclease Cas2 [candidate division KSB1 bacterium]
MPTPSHSFYLISYDIPDDRRRLRVAKILLDFGTRVQYSVFEANLEQRHLERLKQRLHRVLKEDKDSVRIYGLCAQCAARVEILGTGELTRDREVYIV